MVCVCAGSAAAEGLLHKPYNSMDHLNNIRFKRVGGPRFVGAAFHSLSLLFSASSCSPNWPPAGAALLISTDSPFRGCVCLCIQVVCTEESLCDWMYVQWMMCTEVVCVCLQWSPGGMLNRHFCCIASGVSTWTILRKKLSHIPLCSSCHINSKFKNVLVNIRHRFPANPYSSPSVSYRYIFMGNLWRSFHR